VFIHGADTPLFTTSSSSSSLLQEATIHHRFREGTIIVATLSDEKIQQLIADGLTIHDDVPRYPLLGAMREDQSASLQASADIRQDSSSSSSSSSNTFHPSRRLSQDASSSDQKIPEGIGMVQAPQVWKHTKGKGVKICVVDTGVDTNHEDLPPSPEGQTDDLVGHGTHVAGVLVGQDNDVGIVGMAPEAKVHTIQIFSNDSKQAYASDVVAAVNECADVGSNIINLSLGGSEPNSFEMETLDLLLKEKGIISVAAAGNSGTSGFKFPASYSDVISVAAIDGQDQNTTIAAFSQHNSQVNIAAPGVNVLSTLPMNDPCIICNVLGVHSYGSLTGTSTAVPHVVGGLALLLSYKDNMKTPGRVTDAILKTALHPEGNDRDNIYGHGVLQVLAALEYLNGGPLEEDTSNTGNSTTAVPKATTSEHKSKSTQNGLVFSIPQIERKNNNARCPLVGQVSVDFILRTDAYPLDTSFTLVNQSEDRIIWDYSDLGAHQQYRFHRCIEDDLCYILTINDVDGLCCHSGLGGWKITYNDDRSEKGAKFNDKVEIRLGPCDNEIGK